MKTILALLLIILQFAVGAAEVTQSVPSQPLAFIHTTIIDMTGAKPKPNMTVVIIGNRIFAIGKTGRVSLPKNAQVIDAAGKFLIPGLWDMHAHSSGEKTTREVFFPLETANGITGIRDMFSDCYPDCSFNNGGLDDGISLEEVNEWRRQSAAGLLVAPRIIASSPLVDGFGARWQGSLIVKDANEGREAVSYIGRRGSDFVKVYSRLSREAYFAVADESKKQNIVFAGHIPDSISAIEASDAGQKSGEHLTGILLACSTDEAHLRSETLALHEDKATMSRKEIDEKLLATFSKAKADALFARFVANKTWMCPTLTVLRGGAFLDDESFTNDVRLKYLPASLRKTGNPRTIRTLKI